MTLHRLLKPSWMALRPKRGAAWYFEDPVVYHAHLIDEDVRSQWECEHDHETRDEALACAEAKILELE